MDNEEEKVDSQITTENVNSQNDDNLPTIDDYNALVEKNKQLYERAKKAEELAKQTKKEPLPETNKQGDFITRDEARLYAQGYDDDDIEQLRKLAGNGKIADVLENPMFKAYKEVKEKQKKIEKAQIKSKSGGSSESDKPVSEMTDEEHRAFFEKSIGR